MRFRPTTSLSVLALLGTLGCATTTPQTGRAHASARAEGVRVLVPDAHWLTEGEHARVDVAPVRESLASTVRVESDTGLDATCLEDVACLRSEGVARGVSHVLIVELASLGGTFVVRTRLVATASEAGDATRQRVIDDATVERVETAVLEMATDLVSSLVPAPPARRAWYERGYVYVIGVGLVAGAVGTGIAVHRHREGIPDIVVTPP